MDASLNHLVLPSRRCKDFISLRNRCGTNTHLLQVASPGNVLVFDQVMLPTATHMYVYVCVFGQVLQNCCFCWSTAADTCPSLGTRCCFCVFTRLLEEPFCVKAGWFLVSRVSPGGVSWLTGWQPSQLHSSILTLLLSQRGILLCNNEALEQEETPQWNFTGAFHSLFRQTWK